MPYPSNWDRIRELVFKRDNYECQSCGRRGGPRGDAQLHPHHVTPRSEGGSDDMANLVTVCSQCHATTHGNDYLRRDDRREHRTNRRGSSRRRRRSHR